jgi:hypothetical protein
VIGQDHPPCGTFWLPARQQDVLIPLQQLDVPFKEMVEKVYGLEPFGAPPGIARAPPDFQSDDASAARDRRQALRTTRQVTVRGQQEKP